MMTRSGLPSSSCADARAEPDVSRILATVFLILIASPSPTVTADEAAPVFIAIVIDDMGDRLDLGRRALGLPAQVAYAMLPHTPHARALAEAAHAQGHEILLHQPLEAVEPGPLGPGAIVLRTGRAGMERTLQENIDSIPHVVGINNHMGSQLTRHPEYMRWLMAALRDRGDLYFIDSRTTAETLAFDSARDAGVPSIERDVFLDADPSSEAVAVEFERLIEVARRDGYALGIGHPFPATLAHLELALADLESEGIRLVSPSRLIEIAETTEADGWRMSSSRSPQASKN